MLEEGIGKGVLSSGREAFQARIVEGEGGFGNAVFFFLHDNFHLVPFHAMHIEIHVMHSYSFSQFAGLIFFGAFN